MAIPNYTARFPLPEFLPRDEDTVVFCPVWFEGDAVEPDSGTVTLYNAGGDALATPAVTVVDGVATATILASTMADEDYQDKCRLEWALDFTQAGTPATFTKTFVRPASIVRVQLYPVITDDDLFSVAPDLENFLRGSDQTSWQPQIDEAWNRLQLYIYEQGNRANLIATAWTLRDAHMLKTLELCYGGVDQYNTESAYREIAEGFHAKYLAALDRLTFDYESEDEDGTVTEHEQQQRARASVFLTEPKRRRSVWWRY